MPRKDLKKLRKEIDTLDKAFVSLLHRRFTIVKKIVQFKKQNGREITDIARERKMEKERKNWARRYSVSSPLIISLFRLIIKESKRIQKETVGKKKK